MANVQSQEVLLEFRENAFQRLTPGNCVRLVKHSIGQSTYNNISLQHSPEDGSMNRFNSPMHRTAKLALIVAAVRPQDHSNLGSWILLLFSDGIIGWTDELEGLELVSHTKA